MRAKSVRMQNFRSFADMTVELGDLTILIGANGTGKTTVLDALALFASARPNVGEEDYHKGAERIDITLTIEPGAHAVPGRFLRNGTVRLQRSFSRDGAEDKRGIKGEAMLNEGCERIRGLGTTDMKKAAERMQETHKGFPMYKNKTDFLVDLDEYEFRMSQDPAHSRKYRAGFTEYPNWEAEIKKMLRVIPVPAMKNIAADDGEEGARSLLSELMDIVIRKAEKGDEALKETRRILSSAHEGYEKAVRGTLDGLGSDLAESSAAYMRDAEFRIDLEDPRSPASHPRASVRMGDGGFMAPADLAGSGLQRVYLLSLLDTIANRSAGASGGKHGDAASPLRLMAIDEPELYQHPQRQRRMLKSFIDAARSDSPVSIVCSTHSPYFVELQRVETLRLLQKGERRGAQLVTHDDLERLDERLGWAGSAQKRTTWLDMNATHWITEGFFAKLAVVVEGSSDRNALLAAARVLGVDLDRYEITVVPAGSVGNMRIIASLYGEFEIPTYLVWDLDCRGGKCAKKVRARNDQLASIASGRTVTAPKKTRVGEDFACFETNLTEVLSDELLKRGALLEGLDVYGLLREAAEADRQATEDARRKHCACHECRGLPGPRHAADTKEKTGARKKVLKSKLNVFRMLDRLGKRDLGELEKLRIVQIVCGLDKIGARGAPRRRRRREAKRSKCPGDAAGEGRPGSGAKAGAGTARA